jgi:uncharacterized SAM-binding protein YcdF (DUF218 family)
LLPGIPALLLAGGFALFLGQSRAQPERPLRHTDGIAVLTGGPQRVETGLRLLAEGHAEWLIVSGVGRSAELADLARTNNVPAPTVPGLVGQGPDGEAAAAAGPDHPGTIGQGAAASGTGMASPDVAGPGASGPGSSGPGVFGSGVFGSGLPSPKARDTGARDNSGTAASNGPAGPVAGRTPAITLGRTATSTRGNGMEIGNWAREHGIASLRVVTAGYHMPRSLLELRRNLPDVTLVPHPVQAAGPRSGLLLREYVKLIGAMLGLSALKPDAPPR